MIPVLGSRGRRLVFTLGVEKHTWCFHDRRKNRGAFASSCMIYKASCSTFVLKCCVECSCSSLSTAGRQHKVKGESGAQTRDPEVAHRGFVPFRAQREQRGVRFTRGVSVGCRHGKEAKNVHFIAESGTTANAIDDSCPDMWTVLSVPYTIACLRNSIIETLEWPQHVE